MTSFDKCLVFTICILPFTQLRFGLIGVGEIILIILFLSRLRKPIFNIFKKDFIFTKFWACFLILSSLGFLFNFFILGHETGTISSMLFDFSTYIIILMSCFTFENYNLTRSVDFKNIFKSIFLISGSILTVLYIISLTFSSIFGLSLRYFGFFVPLSNNLHQVAMSMSTLPFIGIFIIEGEKNKFKKLFYFFLVLLLGIMIYETGSFKAFAGLILGVVYYIFTKFMNFFNKIYRTYFYAFVLVIVVIICTINFELYYNILSLIFEQEDGGGTRGDLYSKGLSLGLSSFFGRGTGPHITQNSMFYDAHNTLLTVLIQSGFLGILIFLLFFLRQIKNVSKSPIFFSALFPIILYTLGGDILRRLPIWILLMLFYYYNKKKVHIKNS